MNKEEILNNLSESLEYYGISENTIKIFLSNFKVFSDYKYYEALETLTDIISLYNTYGKELDNKDITKFVQRIVGTILADYKLISMLNRNNANYDKKIFKDSHVVEVVFKNSSMIYYGNEMHKMNYECEYKSYEKGCKKIIEFDSDWELNKKYLFYYYAIYKNVLK